MNTIKIKEDIINIIQEDKWMMDILEQARKLNLPDWWIGAGFIRSKVWDVLHEYKTRTPMSASSDIDLIYFDRNDYLVSEAKSEITQKEKYYQEILKSRLPDINWSVTNQARMHLFHGDKQYKSSEEALAQWVETAICMGVKLNRNNKLILSTPRGIDDLINLILRPTPEVKNSIELFYEGIKKKQWLKKWPKLKILAK